MGYEATRNLPLMDVEIETPICKTTQKMLKGRGYRDRADPQSRAGFC